MSTCSSKNSAFSRLESTLHTSTWISWLAAAAPSTSPLLSFIRMTSRMSCAISFSKKHLWVKKEGKSNLSVGNVKQRLQQRHLCVEIVQLREIGHPLPHKRSNDLHPP